MGKRPSFQFYTGDWMKDPCLSLCSPATRGIWIDLICAMHESTTGEITGTLIQLSRLCRCSMDEILTAINELEVTNTASLLRHTSVTRDMEVTVISRRLKNQAKEAISHAERQAKYREKRKSDKKVTSTRARYSSSSSSCKQEIDLHDPGDHGADFSKSAKQKPAKVSKKSKISSDWHPPTELVAWAKEIYYNIDLDFEISQFRDHFVSNGEIRSDWNASFRAWIRNSKKWAKQREPRQANQQIKRIVPAEERKGGIL